MQSKRMLLLFVASFALASAAPFLPDAIAHPHLQENRASADAISGDWNIDFHIQGMTTPGAMTLKREGKKITGTVHSDHTGSGTLSNASFAEGKLSCRMDFPSHESIDVTGSLKDGKLTGEFRTEGRQGTWEATRK
jgi:hypothetical protein